MKKRYRVTGLAGHWVAGFYKPANGVLELTPKQAAFELAQGTIVPDVPEQEKATEEKPAAAVASKPRRARKPKG